jgi:hypothetical protein
VARQVESHAAVASIIALHFANVDMTLLALAILGGATLLKMVLKMPSLKVSLAC